MINKIRLAFPKERGGACSVAQICRGHRAWPRSRHFPLPEDMVRIWEDHPNTTPMACSRRGSWVVNEMTMDGLFVDCECLGYLLADVESDPGNYDQNGDLLPLANLQPSRMPVFVGMKIFLTRNLCKKTDF
eukprot:8622872-Karenia_brevis.AAC.1